MDPQEATGGLENGLHRLDPMPVPGEGIQAFEGFGCRLRREATLPFETRNGRGALDGRTPPSDHSRLAEEEIPDRNRGLLFHQQWYQGRAVPELHRPFSRSSRRASRALAPADGCGGFAIRISRGSGAEARRRSPWRSRRASRPSGSSPSPNTDSRRATGRPRSRMRIVSPCCTWSTSALRLFLVSVRVALFIWLE